MAKRSEYIAETITEQEPLLAELFRKDGTLRPKKVTKLAIAIDNMLATRYTHAGRERHAWMSDPYFGREFPGFVHDSGTSYMAALAVVDRRANAQHTVWWTLKKFGPMTDKDMRVILGYDDRSLRRAKSGWGPQSQVPRRSEMVNKGYIICVGHWINEHDIPEYVWAINPRAGTPTITNIQEFEDDDE